MWQPQVKGLASTEQMTNGQRSKKVDNSVAEDRRDGAPAGYCMNLTLCA